jgi:hypothetical protein
MIEGDKMFKIKLSYGWEKENPFCNPLVVGENSNNNKGK